MTAWMFFGVLALVFIAAWVYLSNNPGPRARIGPDGTNVREPETFVVHHEGKGQGLDIANTALKERTEHIERDLPGNADSIKTPVPGRDMVRMDAPPSDLSRYGDEKVAPGAVPGMPGAESKEKVLTEGPKGSRPETPEEPGSPWAKGRRVTDTHRDVELAAELLPNVNAAEPHRLSRDMAASPSNNGQEPGYGLGRKGPGDPDGEGGDDDSGASYETPEVSDDVPDIPGGDMPTMRLPHHKVVPFPGPRRTEPDQPGKGDSSVAFIPEETSESILFQADPSWSHELSEELDWDGLYDEIPLPAGWGEDAVTALVRNPRSLYIYWERSGHGDENLRAMLGADYTASQPVIRIFDVDSGAYPGQPGGRVMVIHVGEGSDHWWVNEGIEPGHRYVVSYERHTADGRFFLISHSAPVRTPFETPTPASVQGSGLLYERYGFNPGQDPSQSGSSPWR